MKSLSTRKNLCKSGEDQSYNTEMNSNEIYAGHEAWRSWFELCSVKRCSCEERNRLSRQIISALSQALGQYGIRPSDYENEDLSDLFDIHFILKGSNGTSKPLKSYYRARCDITNDEQLKKLICGTFFSRDKGRVRDLVRDDIIPLIKGWKFHKVKGELAWERAQEKMIDDEGHEISAPEQSIETPINMEEMDDHRIWAGHVTSIFKAISDKNKTDAPLLVYAIANGIRPYNPVVWEILDVKSVRANQLFHKAIETMSSYMKKHGLTFEDSEFSAALIAEAKRILGEKQIKKLEESR